MSQALIDEGARARPHVLMSHCERTLDAIRDAELRALAIASSVGDLKASTRDWVWLSERAAGQMKRSLNGLTSNLSLDSSDSEEAIEYRRETIYLIKQGRDILDRVVQAVATGERPKIDDLDDLNH